MTTEIIVRLENRPGSLAQMCEALGDGGVEVEAVQGMAVDTQGIVHFVPSDVDKAVAALDVVGIPSEAREVLCVRVLDEPAKLGDVARVMFEAGINIDVVYVASGGRLILGVDDLPGAEQVASGLAVAE